jgi:hypothetical protein
MGDPRGHSIRGTHDIDTVSERHFQARSKEEKLLPVFLQVLLNKRSTAFTPLLPQGWSVFPRALFRP